MTESPNNGWRRPDGTIDHGEKRRAPRQLSDVPRSRPPRPHRSARSRAASVRRAIGSAWSARYTVQPWSVDRDPPPSVRAFYVVALNVGLVVATRIAFPHSAWPGLALLAALFPVVALATFYAVRSWSRPRPVDAARAAHRQALAPSQYRDRAYEHLFPISFAAMLRASCLIPPTMLVGVVGNYVFMALDELGYDLGAALAGIITWSSILLLVGLSVWVGSMGRPLWLTPFVVREAERTGRPIFRGADFRAD